MSAISPSRFSMLLGTCIVPSVLNDAGVTDVSGIDRFYRSELYELLSDPSTSLWHLSSRTLADMLQAELRGEKFEDPEEQS